MPETQECSRKEQYQPNSPAKMRGVPQHTGVSCYGVPRNVVFHSKKQNLATLDEQVLCVLYGNH